MSLIEKETGFTSCPSSLGGHGTPSVWGGPFRIALWLGHESPETTQIYLQADLALKEKALAKTKPLNVKTARYRPSDNLLQFLNSL
jgi:hypothetical protein